MADNMQHEDFGEKIGGAKKDLWKDRGLYVNDLDAMNEREAEKFVKKDNIWKKPDYGAMLDDGIPLGVVYFIKKARDGLNASPQYYRRDDTPEKRLARQKEYRGQVTTQIKTIEALDGIQSIAADSVTVNYYSDTGNYEDTLDKVVTDINTSAQDSQALISLNAQLKQENSTMREENDNLQERVSTLQEELSERQRDISQLQERISELEKQISIPQDDGTQVDNTSSNITDEKAVYLIDVCPPYESNRYEAPITMKMMGNTYSNGFQLDAAYSGFALFNIDGKYKTLEFDFGHIDGSSMTNVTYNIYLDGRFLQTIDGTSDMKVTHISIPLNQASQLKIDFSTHSGYPVYGFANATLK